MSLSTAGLDLKRVQRGVIYKGHRCRLLEHGQTFNRPRICVLFTEMCCCRRPLCQLTVQLNTSPYSPSVHSYQACLVHLFAVDSAIVVYLCWLRSPTQQGGWLLDP